MRSHVTTEAIEKKERRLIDAATNGDLRSVQILINGGVNVDSFDANRTSALMWAAWSGHIEIVQFLIAEVANINHVNKDGDTAYTFAFRRDHNDITKFLLDQGAIVKKTKDVATDSTIITDDAFCETLAKEIVKNFKGRFFKTAILSAPIRTKRVEKNGLSMDASLIFLSLAKKFSEWQIQEFSDRNLLAFNRGDPTQDDSRVLKLYLRNLEIFKKKLILSIKAKFREPTKHINMSEEAFKILSDIDPLLITDIKTPIHKSLSISMIRYSSFGDVKRLVFCGDDEVSPYYDFGRDLSFKEYFIHGKRFSGIGFLERKRNYDIFSGCGRSWFFGDFVDGVLIKGKGIIEYPNGTIYEGEIENNYPCGKGTVILSSGLVYKGNFTMNEIRIRIEEAEMGGGIKARYSITEEGVFIICDNGISTFKALVPFYTKDTPEISSNRSGAIIYEDRSVYSGDFVMGEDREEKPHGKGFIAFSDGTRYDGYFAMGLFHGDGAITFSDGTKYSGIFEMGLLHGRGYVTFPDGSVFESDFENGLLDGKNILEKDILRYYKKMSHKNITSDSDALGAASGEVVGDFMRVEDVRSKGLGAGNGATLSRGAANARSGSGVKLLPQVPTSDVLDAVVDNFMGLKEFTIISPDGTKYKGDAIVQLGRGVVTLSDGARYEVNFSDKDGLLNGRNSENVIVEGDRADSEAGTLGVVAAAPSSPALPQPNMPLTLAPAVPSSPAAPPIAAPIAPTAEPLSGRGCGTKCIIS